MVGCFCSKLILVHCIKKGTTFPSKGLFQWLQFFLSDLRFFQEFFFKLLMNWSVVSVQIITFVSMYRFTTYQTSASFFFLTFCKKRYLPPAQLEMRGFDPQVFVSALLSTLPPYLITKFNHWTKSYVRKVICSIDKVSRIKITLILAQLILVCTELDKTPHWWQTVKIKLTTEQSSRSHISIVVRGVLEITDNNRQSFDNCHPYINLLYKYKI